METCLRVKLEIAYSGVDLGLHVIKEVAAETWGDGDSGVGSVVAEWVLLDPFRQEIL